MTNALKAGALFKVLTLAPMNESEPTFRRFAEAGDVDGFWAYYQVCLKNVAMDERIEKQGLVSFRMLRSAMTALYSLSA
jgi:hypothetical protein